MKNSSTVGKTTNCKAQFLDVSKSKQTKNEEKTRYTNSQ